MQTQNQKCDEKIVCLFRRTHQTKANGAISVKKLSSLNNDISKLGLNIIQLKLRTKLKVKQRLGNLPLS